MRLEESSSGRGRKVGLGRGDREEEEGAVEQSGRTWESLGHPRQAGNH